jgi:hypothetical protein
MCKNNQDDDEYIVDDRPREIPEDIKNMTKEELEAEFRRRFPDAE